MTEELFTITVLGELLDDLERTRIAARNRIGAFEREVGVPQPMMEVAAVGVEALEQQVRKDIAKIWRKHPLSKWSKSVPGAGDLLMARLIAVIGDPADAELRPNPGKLLAYCGHGAPLKKTKGMTQAQAFKLGNPHAKKRVWLLSTQFVKTPSSPYRTVYDEARERYDERLHESACVRCGPSGHPALPGSPWSKGHQHAAALRFVGKRFLIDLWKEDRKLKGLSIEQPDMVDDLLLPARAIALAATN